MVAFDNRRPNVVAFGDSNEYVFGPALRRHLVEDGGFAIEQIVVKYRTSSRPRNWLRRTDALYDGDFGELWRTLDAFPEGPPVADVMSPATVLVEIGLGGNLGLSSAEQRSIAALVEQVQRAAPNARIVWRGPPPATASHDGAVAPPAVKLARYERNAMLKRALTPLGFTVIGPDHGSACGVARAYLDLIAMHAGGPAPADTHATGTEAAHAYERAVLANAHDGADTRGERAAAGPWTEFVRGRDAMPVHVPSEAALAVVRRVIAPMQLFPLEPPARPPGGYAAHVVVADAWVRTGPPKFRWLEPQLIPMGTELLVLDWAEGYGLVRGFDGREWGWTALSNLRFR